MEAADFSTTGENKTKVKAAQITKPTTEMVKIMSNELLKVFELNEHCNCKINFLVAESDLIEWYKKVQTLTSAKNESSKIMAEYKSRNKINVINSESLHQALKELYNYKCELKSAYVAVEKELKTKDLKYKKIIYSYESAWEKALKEYNSDPFFMELNEIEREKTLLEVEIAKQEKLKASTETQFAKVTETIMKTMKEKTVEFSEAMIRYKLFLNSTKRSGKNKCEKRNSSDESFRFKLFTAEISQSNKKFNLDINDDPNFIDVSVFDDITIPSENLEEEVAVTDVSKEEEEEEAFEYLNNSRQTVQPENKSSLKGPTDDSAQAREKIMDDNESHYFQQQATETLRQPPGENVVEGWSRLCENLEKNPEKNVVKLKSVNNAAGLQQPESEEEIPKDMQMECEESLSEESYEKQMEGQRAENYEFQCHKTSFSSDDLLPAVENPKESPEPACKLQRGKFNSEKSDFKSFAGFFTMGNDQDTPKPSIFKLF